MSNPMHGNVLSFLRRDLQRHQVKVKLSNPQEQASPDEAAQNYYLIIMRGQTKPAEEFMAVYSEETGMVNLANRIFGTEETVCDYGVLLNEDLQIIFAFNRLFADYDPEKQEVVFKTAERALIDQLNRNRNDGLPSFPDSPDDSNMMTLYGGFPESPGTALVRYGAFPATDANAELSAPAD
ncbi:MAG: hypothetical protein WC668_02980 [Patescibacteria group bacterium]|jgi:hypothetical protein